MLAADFIQSESANKRMIIKNQIEITENKKQKTKNKK